MRFTKTRDLLRRMINTHRLLAAVVAMLAMFAFAAEESSSIGVVYPEVEEPYMGIFLQIIEGIKAGARGEVISYRIMGEASANAINAWAHSHSLKRVILLGRQNIKAARLLDPSIRVVVGGALVAAAADMPIFSAVSLAPDPESLFKTLKQIAPLIERVIVVYSPA